MRFAALTRYRANGLAHHDAIIHEILRTVREHVRSLEYVTCTHDRQPDQITGCDAGSSRVENISIHKESNAGNQFATKQRTQLG